MAVLCGLVLAPAAWAYEPVEPPPAEYATGEVAGVKERRFDSADRLSAFCAEHLGPPPVGQHFRACYVPGLRLVALPSASAVPDDRERAELRAHEMAHARGWRHPLDMKTLMARYATK